MVPHKTMPYTTVRTEVPLFGCHLKESVSVALFRQFQAAPPQRSADNPSHTEEELCTGKQKEKSGGTIDLSNIMGGKPPLVW